MPEMAKKLVGNNFWIFGPPPPHPLIWDKKMITKKIKFVPKWLENWSEITFTFLEPMLRVAIV